MAKGFKRSFKRTFKKYGFKKGRRSKYTGRILYNSILAQTAKRKLETYFPVYLISTGTAVTLSSPPTFLAGPSLTNVANQYGAILTPMWGLSEFTNAARSWGLFRINGVAIKYFGGTSASTSFQPGVMSIAINNRPAIDINAAWFQDNSLRVQLTNTTAGGSKSKYYKNPLRTIEGGNGVASNAWIPCNVPASPNIYLQIGTPSATATSPNHVTPNNNDIILIGRIQVKAYLTFSQPQVYA